MERFMKLLTYVDQFGATYQTKILDGNSKYRSPFGGIATIIIYSLSIAYMAYVFDQWGKGELVPRLSSQMEVTQYEEVKFSDSPFYINFLGLTPSFVDPFDLKKNILTPILITITGVSQSKPINLLSFSSNDTTPFISRGIQKNDIELVVNLINNQDSSLKEQTQQLLLFVRCQDGFLIDGQQCADEATIDKFLSTSFAALLNVNIMLQSYNPITNEYMKVNKQIYLTLDKDFVIYNQLLLKQSKMEVDSGVLFPIQESQSIITDVTVITQSLSRDSFKYFIPEQTLEGAYAAFLLRLDPLAIRTYVNHPKLGEVLAQIGSIVQILMLGQFVFVALNDHLMNREIINRLMTQFFPQMKACQISKNLRGKVTKIQSRNNENNYDVETFNYYYHEINQQFTSRLELVTLHTNLIKMQLIIMASLPQFKKNKNLTVGLNWDKIMKCQEESKVPLSQESQSNQPRITHAKIHFNPELEEGQESPVNFEDFCCM